MVLTPGEVIEFLDDLLQDPDEIRIHGLCQKDLEEVTGKVEILRNTGQMSLRDDVACIHGSIEELAELDPRLNGLLSSLSIEVILG